MIAGCWFDFCGAGNCVIVFTVRRVVFLSWFAEWCRVLVVFVSGFVCDTSMLVSCVIWSSGVTNVNGGVASGLGGLVLLSVIRFSESVLGVGDGGCMLEI